MPLGIVPLISKGACNRVHSSPLACLLVAQLGTSLPPVRRPPCSHSARCLNLPLKDTRLSLHGSVLRPGNYSPSLPGAGKDSLDMLSLRHFRQSSVLSPRLCCFPTGWNGNPGLPSTPGPAQGPYTPQLGSILLPDLVATSVGSALPPPSILWVITHLSFLDSPERLPSLASCQTLSSLPNLPPVREQLQTTSCIAPFWAQLSLVLPS